MMDQKKARCRCPRCGHHLSPDEVSRRIRYAQPHGEVTCVRLDYLCRRCQCVSWIDVRVADWRDASWSKLNPQQQVKRVARAVLKDRFLPENSPEAQVRFEELNAENITEDEQTAFRLYLEDNDACLNDLLDVDTFLTNGT